jgi:hypothetical protein
MGMGGDEHPARPEEVRRKGWHARRVVRVPSLPPLHKSFVAAARVREMSRGAETGGRLEMKIRGRKARGRILHWGVREKTD